METLRPRSRPRIARVQAAIVVAMLCILATGVTGLFLFVFNQISLTSPGIASHRDPLRFPLQVPTTAITTQENRVLQTIGKLILFPDLATGLRRRTRFYPGTGCLWWRLVRPWWLLCWTDRNFIKPNASIMELNRGYCGREVCGLALDRSHRNSSTEIMDCMKMYFILLKNICNSWLRLSRRCLFANNIF